MAFADAGCVLRVDIRCEQCKYKILEVLSSIVGVYNVDMDGERGLVMIAGEVDPNILLKALARTGRHAELIRVNFKHPNWSGTHSNYDAGCHSSTYASLGHHFPRSSPADAYSYTPSVFGLDYPFRRSAYGGCGLPRRRPLAVPPLYPRRGYGPYDDYFNRCSCCSYM